MDIIDISNNIEKNGDLQYSGGPGLADKQGYIGYANSEIGRINKGENNVP